MGAIAKRALSLLGFDTPPEDRRRASAPLFGAVRRAERERHHERSERAVGEEAVRGVRKMFGEHCDELVAEGNFREIEKVWSEFRPRTEEDNVRSSQLARKHCFDRGWAFGYDYTDADGRKWRFMEYPDGEVRRRDITGSSAPIGHKKSRTEGEQLLPPRAEGEPGPSHWSEIVGYFRTPQGAEYLRQDQELAAAKDARTRRTS